MFLSLRRQQRQESLEITVFQTKQSYGRVVVFRSLFPSLYILIEGWISLRVERPYIIEQAHVDHHDVVEVTKNRMFYSL